MIQIIEANEVRLSRGGSGIEGRPGILYQERLSGKFYSWSQRDEHFVVPSFWTDPNTKQSLDGALDVPVPVSGAWLSAARGIAPSGSVSAVGAMTLGTALPATFSDGLWLYFPAGIVSGSSAGLFWCVMSSTTAGTVYESVGGAAVVGTGSYTGVTTEVTLWSASIVATVKQYIIRAALAHTNSAGTKTLRLRFDSNLLATTSATTSPGQAAGLVLSSLGNTLQGFAQAVGTGSTSYIGFTTTDGTAEKTVDVTAQIAVATDALVLINASVV